MRWYLDASVALHAVLPVGPSPVQAWLEARLMDDDEILSSVLLELELVRTLRRERLAPARAQMVTRRISLVSIDDGVLRVAAAIEPHVKSLDAIHLATCSMLGSGITLVTHDASMTAVARTLGLDTFDPLASGDVR